MKMDKVENTQEKVAMKGPTSQIVGPEKEIIAPTMVAVRGKYTGVPEDTIDWSKRLFSIDEVLGHPLGLDMGPALTSEGSYMINHLFKDVEILSVACRKYWALKYDQIEVNFTLSNPKNLVGGVHLGWWPYQDYYDKNSTETMTVIYASPMLSQGLINGPYTHQNLYGMAKDTMFTIPWPYKTPVMPSALLTADDETDPALRPVYGTPILWWQQLPNTAYVTSVANPAKMHIWVRFVGLEFFGPTNQNLTEVIEKQSGAAVTAAVALASTVIGDEVVGLANDLGDMMFPKDEPEEMAEAGTYDLPQAVQLAYCGDTTNMDYPNTSPIFYEAYKPEGPPISTVAEMLSRPQYLGSFTTSTATATLVSNNPMSFEAPGGTIWNKATYFRWFGMLNRYWRGTICLHVVTAGHPMVEVQLESMIQYPFYLDVATERTSNITRHVSIFNGNKLIVVHMPFLTADDYMPVYDAYPSDSSTAWYNWTSMVSLKTSIVSTMLDTAPVIPSYIYVSAGPDFAFYQPLPPGLYNPVLSDLDSRERGRRRRQHRVKSTGKGKEREIIEKQVFIPLESEAEHMKSRHGHTTDPGTMINMATLYDYMKLWSRCVPFLDYDNEGDQEPIPDPDVGLKCATWYVPVDRSATEDANNSWYFTLDYIAYFAMQFLFYRGAIGFKVVVCTDAAIREPGGYVYVALANPVEVYRQKTHVPWAYDDKQVPPESNFGAGVVITPTDQQPILECTIPYRGSNTWSYCNNNAYYRDQQENWQAPNAGVANNLILMADVTLQGNTLADAMFRKIGTDFVLGVETILPPPTMWIARGFDWSA